MISEIESKKIDNWLEQFEFEEKEHSDKMIFDDNFMRSLAYALCEDSPFGYEASHRLANWIFGHLNTPKIYGEPIKKIQYMTECQETAEKALDKAFCDYKRYTQDLMSTFINLVC